MGGMSQAFLTTCPMLIDVGRAAVHVSSVLCRCQ